MTLVISFLSKNKIITISDRRFTITRRNNIGYDDRRNKIIQYQDRFLVSFTGIANFALSSKYNDLNFEETGTDIWLLKYLSKYLNPSDAIENLPDSLLNHYKKKKFKNALLAVAISGWRRIGVAPLRYEPGIFVCTNFDNKTCKLLNENAPFFQVYFQKFHDRNLSASIGSSIPNELWESFNKKYILEQSVTTKVRVNAAVRLMRRISRSNRMVGRDYLISIIPDPLSFDRPDRIIAVGSFEENLISHFYLPASRSDAFPFRGDPGVLQYGPHLTVGDGMAYADCITITNGSDQIVKTRIFSNPQLD